MAESIKLRIPGIPDDLAAAEIRALFVAVQADIAALQTALNAHTHGGITTGAGTSGVANASTMGALNTLA